ncbi:Protein of unknown function [Pyronema omphalodes CBS 100304]|uniref:Uncharacterized protein n=1 Tax=Pyronema omphalodes (strain CBS 100304) TaxID=1076935 RepID=U4L368_PYROM|nr:Protein of unknown function [Pyronema omphalodes CBS 100304]
MRGMRERGLEGSTITPLNVHLTMMELTGTKTESTVAYNTSHWTRRLRRRLSGVCSWIHPP